MKSERSVDGFCLHVQEHLVVIELKGVIDNKFLYNCKSANWRLLEIDSDQPLLQIGNYTFTGQFKESIGTHVLFEELDSTDDQGTKKLKYKCNTTKTLEMNRVFLTEKDKAEKGTEKEVGSSTHGEVENQIAEVNQE